MLSRPLALVAALAILASLFLPWLSSPFGENVVPWTVLRALDAEGAQAILADARPETIAYGCSFVMAALFILFALIGVVVFWLSFVIIDKITPYNLWQELVEKQNMALGMVVAAMSLGISIIVAAAIHG